MELQLELARRQISYVITSGVRFFEQAHIKDVISIVRILANPGDSLAFHRLVEHFPKLGQKTAAKIWEALGKRFEAKQPEHRKYLASLLPAGARGAEAKIRTDPGCLRIGTSRRRSRRGHPVGL